jgi:phage N-6-adenine-methyltransferase
MISPALYSSRSEEWTTPASFYAKLNAEFDFDLDAAATAENTKCLRYLDIQTDALKVNWAEHGSIIFCNPPYGREIGKWFAKAREAQAAGALVVMLAPARTDTRWWHEHVQGIASEVRFVKGRLKFGDGKQSAPFPSAVIIYRPDGKARLRS